MVQGSFIQNVPLIPVTVAFNHAVQTPFFILDTGFTGDLQVTRKIAQELGLKVSGVTQSRIANGQIIAVPTAIAVAAMAGVAKIVQVLISDSSPLAGISLLTKFGYTAVVDCKNRTVALTP
jgi:predicted aspartyl protease